MESMTYQHLPPWLLEPLEAGVLSLPEAAEMWDEWLLTPDGQSRDLPQWLSEAAARLELWQMAAAEFATLESVQ